MSSDHNRIKLKLINKQISGKYPNFWKLNNTVLNNLWIKVEASKETFKIFWIVQKYKTTYQNVWDITKTVLKGQLIAFNAYKEKDYLRSLI